MAALSVGTQDGEARTGTLRTSHGTLTTPALLLHTSRGLPPFLTLDNLATLRPQAAALQICLAHFTEYPSAKDVRTLFGEGGAHAMTSLHDYVLVGVPRDVLQFANCLKVENALRGPSLVTPGGFRQVSPDEYMKCVEALKPDIFTLLSDEQPAYSNDRKHKQSVERTQTWVEGCCAQRAAGVGAGGLMLAPIVGGSALRERTKSAEAMAKLESVAGFTLTGFGLGEPPAQRAELLAACIKPLPPGKIRHVMGLGMPEEVLLAVEHGVDLLDSIYPYTLTVKGFGMTFDPDVLRDGFDTAASPPGVKLNLRSLSYMRDTRPVLPGCVCVACTRHTRAYIHHLLNTHEMLGEALLDLHNNHHYLRFFERMRAAIAQRRFGEYKARLLQQLHAERFML